MHSESHLEEKFQVILWQDDGEEGASHVGIMKVL